MKKVFSIMLLLMLVMVTVASGAAVKKYFDPNQPYAYSPNAVMQRTITGSTYTVLAADHMINASTASNGIVFTLPAATSLQVGKAYIFKKTSALNTVEVVASTTDSITNTIAGSAARYMCSALNSYLVITLGPDGDWKVSWESDPVQKDMSTGVVTIGTTTYAM